MVEKRLMLGKRGEKVAARFLKRKGCKIVQRNYRCNFGEIDLIAANGEYLVFVEVKTRSDNSLMPLKMP